MRIQVDKTTIQDLDRGNIQVELEENQDDLGGLTPGQISYFHHRGHRVFIDRVRDTSGAATELDATPDAWTALNEIKPTVNQAIFDSGAGPAGTDWTFSEHAGCGMCPCSPGFLVSGNSAHEKEVHVDITVHRGC